MSKFLQGIKGKEKTVVTPQDIDAIAEKLHANIETSKVAVTKSATPKAVAQDKTAVKPKQIVIEEIEEAKKSTRPADTHRLTLDIPNELIEQMKKDTKRSGQTIKGFIVSLIYDFYENKG